MPAPPFRLLLLGRVQLLGPSGPVELPNKKLAGLLAYLACAAPPPQPREKLSALFWGSHFDTQAKQNLRQTVFRLRKLLGQEALLSTGELIGLEAGVLSCDVVELQSLIKEGTRDALAAAADLYQDRFLADVAIPEEAWNDWLSSERERLEGLD